MPRAIVKQPNEKYAVWSTIVDDFVLIAASAEEAIVEELNDPNKQNYPGGMDELRKDLCREFENILSTGRAWRWAPNWQEAIEIIRELHGAEVAEDRDGTTE